MAYCPECKAEIAADAVVCEHCGYDFPSERSPANRGFAYSTLADIALIISMIAAVLGCAVTVLMAIGAVMDGELMLGLVAAPIAFFLQLGMLVVFLRVQDR